MTLLITVNIKYRCNVTFIIVISKVNICKVIFKYGRGVLIFFGTKKILLHWNTSQMHFGLFLDLLWNEWKWHHCTCGQCYRTFYGRKLPSINILQLC